MAMSFRSFASFTFFHSAQPDSLSRGCPALLEPAKIAIGQGHFYAPRLLDALGLPSTEGIVRASMVHYNTMEEVERLIEGLDQAI